MELGEATERILDRLNSALSAPIKDTKAVARAMSNCVLEVLVDFEKEVAFAAANRARKEAKEESDRILADVRADRDRNHKLYWDTKKELDSVRGGAGQHSGNGSRRTAIQSERPRPGNGINGYGAD